MVRQYATRHYSARGTYTSLPQIVKPKNYFRNMRKSGLELVNINDAPYQNMCRW